MKQLSKIENIIFLVGAILMVAGSAAGVFVARCAPWVFGIGALMFVGMQLKQTYNGSSTTIHRLRSILIFSDIAFLAAAFLMFENQYRMLGLSQIQFAQYIHNNWVVALLIGAIVQLYATHRLGKELEKEED